MVGRAASASRPSVDLAASGNTTAFADQVSQAAVAARTSFAANHLAVASTSCAATAGPEEAPASTWASLVIGTSSADRSLTPFSVLPC